MYFFDKYIIIIIIIIIEAPKRKPQLILKYNRLKGGVDSVDQMLRHYTTKVASRRWSLAVFCNVIDIASLNAFVLWKHIARIFQISFASAFFSNWLKVSSKNK